MNIKAAIKQAPPQFKDAINELGVSLDTLKTNEPINRKEGDIAQANLEKREIASHEAAIKELAKPKRRFFPDRDQKKRLAQMNG